MRIKGISLWKTLRMTPAHKKHSAMLAIIIITPDPGVLSCLSSGSYSVCETHWELNMFSHSFVLPLSLECQLCARHWARLQRYGNKGGGRHLCPWGLHSFGDGSRQMHQRFDRLS